MAMPQTKELFRLYLAIEKQKGRKSLSFAYIEDGDYFLAKAPASLTDEYIEEAAKRSIKSLVRLRDRKLAGRAFYVLGQPHPEIPEEEQEAYLSGSLREYLSKRVPVIARELGISFPFKVEVKPLKSVYGINYVKKKLVRFSSTLGRFSYPVIDSVVYHELCHFYYQDHQKKFYNLLLEHCPRYWEYRKALNKNDYGYRAEVRFQLGQ